MTATATFSLRECRQEADLVFDRRTINVWDVARFLAEPDEEGSTSTARRLLDALEADGLRRKGSGRGVCYCAAEFLEAWHRHDTRP